MYRFSDGTLFNHDGAQLHFDHRCSRPLCRRTFLHFLNALGHVLNAVHAKLLWCCINSKLNNILIQVLLLYLFHHKWKMWEQNKFWFCGNTTVILNSQKYKVSSVAVSKSKAFYKCLFSCNAAFPSCLCVVFFRSGGGHAGSAGQLQYHSKGTEAVLQ